MDEEKTEWKNEALNKEIVMNCLACMIFSQTNYFHKNKKVILFCNNMSQF